MIYMNAIEVVKAGIAAAESGDIAKYQTLLADDMVFAGPVPKPLSKQEFIGLQTALISAFPDWKFNASDFKENGDQVVVMVQITGTQTKELSLPMPGLPKIPPTGKHVSLPKEPTTFTVKNGKITRLETSAVAGGGVMGILTQLGVSLPPMP
jgi:predicted ester cyclase